MGCCESDGENGNERRRSVSELPSRHVWPQRTKAEEPWQILALVSRGAGDDPETGAFDWLALKAGSYHPHLTSCSGNYAESS